MIERDTLRRRWRVRARTVARRALLAVVNANAGEDYPDEVERPRMRGDCAQVERPCPFVSCRHHLYLDVNEQTGGVKLNFPELEPDELTHSCALDLADEGGLTLEDVGQRMNITRERVRQIEVRALIRGKRLASERGIDIDEVPGP